MVEFNPEFAKKHIMEVSDEELMIISNSNTDEYRQEVIDFAKEELKKRGLIETSKEKSDEIKKQWEEEGKKEKGLSIRWLNFYIKVRLPFGILLGLILVLLGFYKNKEAILFIIDLFFIIFCILVLIGLSKRRFWGWILNWIWLVFETFTFPLENHSGYFFTLIIILLVWFLPNAIYFYKRRHLFY